MVVKHRDLYRIRIAVQIRINLINGMLSVMPQKI